MTLSTHKPLTVYKASAGSGKTFTLATEYMKLVIANPEAYRSILAVTFTNKATEEMKLRIISQLYGLSKLLPESETYLKVIQDSLGMDREQIAKRAHEALYNLLHHYSYFRVETIDSFFQRVMRNLAKELELSANLKLELNDREIERQAVDELIEGLSIGDKLLTWILDYIKGNIGEDKNWNVIGKIKRFGENLSKDFYKANEKQLRQKLEEEGFFERYSRQLEEVKRQAMEQVEQIAATFFDALDENGLTMDDFSRKKQGPWGYFEKLRTGACYEEYGVNSYQAKAVDSVDAWFTKAKATPQNPAYHVVEEMLRPLLEFAVEKMPQLLGVYRSVEVTKSNLSQLRLLGSIDQKIKEMNQDANRFLLSDTQPLLHALMESGAGDSSFIFEKIGTQLEHIMIDEFQDTSVTQWKNFKVLLDETMSHKESNNLIVGDVKQSIYRWRAGDWRLLNDIEREFPRPSDQLRLRSLATNYRSDRNVIEFNNQFFVYAADKEYQAQKETDESGAETLRQAYADVIQQVPESKPRQGYVRIKLLPKEEYREAMLALTAETVDELISQGACEGDIAILIRSNEIIRDVANYFLANRPQYKLVSDEAFRLDASTAVNTLVMALRLLCHQDDIVEATLSGYYHRLIMGEETEESLPLPLEYTDHKEELMSMPLYDLVERLATIFRVHELKDQSAYVCAFYDQLDNYMEDGTGTVEDFLDAWDNNLHDKTIQSDEVAGIRLMTIHKSKGLEFAHVIMPFCDWPITKSHVIWCTPQASPFNELPLVPVDCSKSRLQDTIYEKDYHYERLQETVDNLNLLYVAFTRARQNLFVYGKRDISNIRSRLIQDCLPDVARTLEGCKLSGMDEEKTEPIVMEYGELDINRQRKAEKESDNVFLKPVNRLTIHPDTYPLKARFRQSNKSRDFIKGDDEQSTRGEYIQLGVILHQVFSTIQTADDVESALSQLRIDGVLNAAPDEEKLREMLQRRLQTPKVKEWFSGQWEVYNERDILTVDEQSGEVKTYRPDRVMVNGTEMIVVDFKFAAQRPEHVSQVKGYMELLKRMSHLTVKGYLWYVYPNKIVTV